ncbi:unnamed protein product [Mytilus coruscus]|uniref:C-type lectin domain-containing protein n=1 Tax=Mytilus coruscus TaxID=42192 RepID=A0A6J8EWE4_MYTCO|nr:unnamed protein product [Mytilus coruscus]
MAMSIVRSPSHCMNFHVFEILSLADGIVVFKANLKIELNELFEKSGAVGITLADNKIRCIGDCESIGECLSVFYNVDSKECVMHNKQFDLSSFPVPSGSGAVWRYYFTEDVTGTCSPENNYYRPLQFCYSVHEITSMNFTDTNAFCAARGGKLAAVTSQEMQDYFTDFLADRPHIRICIASKEQPDGSWELEDGTTMSYFNWYPGQPESATQPFIVIKATSLGDIIHESDPIDFTQIKAFCSSRGGELAAVSSDKMNSYFKEFLDVRPHIRVCIAGEEQQDGSWALEDGTTMSYFNWYPGQPESGNQGCIVIKDTSLGDMWMDASCAYSKSCSFVCKY